MVIWPGQGLLSSDEWHGCPGGKGTRAAALAGTQGEHTNAVGDQVFNRIHQVLGLITLFGLPVYSTIHARVVNDSTVIGEVGMALIQGVSGVKKMGLFGTSGSGKSRAMESARGDTYVSELKARVVAIESQLAQITQLFVKMSGSFEGN